MIHAAPGLFLRYEPVGEAVPLLVDVSRSGREYPKEYRSPLPFTTVHDNVSMYVENLWAGAPGVGATLLYCSFPNTWVDVNRSELDMDPDVVDGQWPVELKPTARTMEGSGSSRPRRATASLSRSASSRCPRSRSGSSGTTAPITPS